MNYRLCDYDLNDMVRFYAFEKYTYQDDTELTTVDMILKYIYVYL